MFFDDLGFEDMGFDEFANERKEIIELCDRHSKRINQSLVSEDPSGEVLAIRVYDFIKNIMIQSEAKNKENSQEWKEMLIAIVINSFAIMADKTGNWSKEEIEKFKIKYSELDSSYNYKKK